ncbi:hypothetical protein TPHA_0F02290 [Tetrapisispora phaffii CBS 4417]|uniref:Uncharacterized protein n=1 Tax=Tetrapisispora phaffii (strain ATCC 24235 / CBS 4417 / NBRC 1672 / NRRL Y-8282 / UCD 70-5) TaxID=1071381 RepID=G8BUC4_TETPH|nr:hypothetical protein TPHA_0F02290 [Tetrapisispora phaffii CBS 4417]CCE63710.1 hypothetical protein TPHA_0F02290 [Tetrapisispora phaffii CBS 4417]
MYARDCLQKQYYNDTNTSPPNDRGEVWISPSRLVVEWYMKDVLIRRFNFTQQVIKAGLIDFADSKNCIVIIVSDLAHVYDLKDGNSKSVSFPFPIITAFWYHYGVVLQKQDNDVLSQVNCDNTNIISKNIDGSESNLNKYITLTDPMCPFGLITFTTNDAFNNILDPNDIDLILTPQDLENKISVAYDRNSKEVVFFYSKVLDAKQSDIPLSNNMDRLYNQNYNAQHTGISSTLKRQTSTSRRQLSTYLSKTEDAPHSKLLINNNNNNNNDNNNHVNAHLGKYKQNFALDSPVILPNNAHRSLSATFDRMTNINNPPSIDFAPSTGSHLQPEYLSQDISLKDTILTKISSLQLPNNIIDDKKNTQFIPLKFEDMEAIVIFNQKYQYMKLWLIKLDSKFLDSIQFKIPELHVDKSINFIDIHMDHPVDSILPYHNNNIPGSIILTYDHESIITIYNPFLNNVWSSIKTDMHSIPKLSTLCYISSEEMIFDKFQFPNNEKQNFNTQSLFPYPQKSSVKACFSALQLIFPIDIFIAFVFLWQEIYFHISTDKTYKTQNLEFDAFFMIYKILLEQDSMVTTHNYLSSNSLQYLGNSDISTILPNSILGLHLVREEQNLNILYKKDVDNLADLLHLATKALNWPSTWNQYYLSTLNLPTVKVLDKYTSFPLDEPPSIFKSIFSITDGSYLPITPFINFSRLIERGHEYDEIITPRTYKLLHLFESLHNNNFNSDNILNLLNELNITKEELETYPLGIMTPLNYMLKNLENNLSSIEGTMDVSILSRNDLKQCRSIINSILNKQTTRPVAAITHDSKMSIYSCTGNENSKNIKTLLTDIVTTATENNSKNLLLDNNGDDKETDYGISSQENTNLIFSHDRRFNNALSLLLYYKPHAIPFYSKQSEYIKIINQKKIFAQIVFLRTCVAGIGLGAIVYASEKPLSTQKWVIPKLNFVSLFSDGTKVSLESSEVNKDALMWGEFHAGVSSGLRIFKKVNNINGSWISFNKPKELDSQHGGFLLGLGLNGHLKNLEEWHVYNYLSPKNTHISIGLLLGMSVSMRGTMDVKLVKVFTVHVVALLPQRSNDLNINIEVQTAGLVGIGFLYLKTNNTKMSGLLLSQITSNININDENKPNEGYRIAAGIAYGLVNLNADVESNKHSKDKNISINEQYDSKSKLEVTHQLLKLITSTYEKEPSWIPQNSHTGAIVALMFIHLRSNDADIAMTLKPYSNKSNLRPEYLLYVEWAYYMIMWDEIEDNIGFIFQDLEIKLHSTINSDNMQTYSIISGRILAMGIKYASTGDLNIKRILLKILDKFLPFYQYPGSTKVDFKLSISTINVLINTILVTLGLIMCGTGDLQVFQRIKYLHETITGKHADLFYSSKKDHKDKEVDNDIFDITATLNTNDEVQDVHQETANGSSSENTSEKERFKDDENHYSKYMCTSLSLGFLFLASGQYAINISDNESIAYLIMSLLPTFYKPYYLQELRHFWSLSVEPRCLVIKDIESNLLIKDPVIEIDILTENNDIRRIKKNIIPCLLPDPRKITMIKVEHPSYYPLQLNFDENVTVTEFLNDGLVIKLQKKDQQNELNVMSSNIKSENLVSDINERIYDDSEMDNKQSLPTKVSHILEKNLNIINLTMSELSSSLNDIEKKDEVSQMFNFEIMYSDLYSDDIVDFELEIWRKRQETLTQTKLSQDNT